MRIDAFGCNRLAPTTQGTNLPRQRI